jgi:hypothetical protein
MSHSWILRGLHSPDIMPDWDLFGTEEESVHYEAVNTDEWAPVSFVLPHSMVMEYHPEAGVYWAEVERWQHATALDEYTSWSQQEHDKVEAVRAKERKRKRANHKRNRREHNRLEDLAAQPARPDIVQDVHVLANRPLPNRVRESLGLGMKFVPTQPSLECCQPEEVGNAVEELGRTLAWQLFFKNRGGADKERKKPRFWVKKNTAGPYGSLGVVGKILQKHIKKCASALSVTTGMYANVGPSESNLSIATRKALHELSVNEEFVVKLADKNMGVCILDKTQYQSIVMTFLSSDRDFAKCDQSAEVLINLWTANTDTFIQSIKEDLSLFKADMPSLETFLCTEREHEVPHFYTLIKVHKTPPVGRPITACVKAPTTWLAKVAAAYLHDLMIAMFPQVLKDSKDFVATLDKVVVPETSRASCWLVTLDVVGLYTNIPIPTAVHNIRTALVKYVNSLNLNTNFKVLALKRVSTLMRIVHYVFKNMWVQYEGNVYHQIHGFPMGSSLSPDAANIYMAFMEDLQGLYNRAGSPLIGALPEGGHLLLFKRFIDDYGIILSGITKAQLTSFLAELKNRVAPLQLTEVVSQEEMIFLDTAVYKGEEFSVTGKFNTRTYSKPGNCYSYVHRTSMHVPPTFKGVVRGELVRYTVTCSTEREFALQADRLKQRLLRRGYEVKLIDREIQTMQHAYLQTRTKQLQGAGFKIQDPPYWLTPERESQIVATSSTPITELQCTPITEPQGPPITVFLKLRYDNTTSHIKAKDRLYTMKTNLLNELHDRDLRGHKLTKELERMQLTVCHTRGPTLGAMLVKANTAPRQCTL